MSNATSPTTVYQLKVVLKGISPMIWRRLLVSGQSSIEDLHYILQIAMGWSDEHLHQFVIHGKRYGVYHPGGISFSDDPKTIRLSDFQWREREKFRYDYDFSDGWQHEIRVESVTYPSALLEAPICLAGKRCDFRKFWPGNGRPIPEILAAPSLNGEWINLSRENHQCHLLW